MMTTAPSTHRRILPGITSLLLILVALWLGVSTLPPSVFPRNETTIQLFAESSPRVYPQHPTPVFLFDADFFPMQCGSVVLAHHPSPEFLESNPVTLTPYRSKTCVQGVKDAQMLYLQPASLHLLWALLPTDAREALAKGFWGSAQGLGRHVADAFDSGHYERIYRQELMDIARDAARRVIEDPEQQAMIIETVRMVNPQYVDRYVNEIWPVVREKAGSSLWDSLHGFAGGIIGWGDTTNRGSFTGRMLQSIAEDPRGLELAFEIGLEFLAEPQVVHLTNHLGQAFIKDLLTDPRLPPLIDRMLMDPQLFPEGHGLKLDLDFLVRELPKRLLRYRHPKDHNPLVAYLVRAIVRGDTRYVVLALNDFQTDQTTELGFTAGIPLHRSMP